MNDTNFPLFYQEFLAERDEVLRHKWHMSENAGRDVGFDAALIDWVMHHRGGWIGSRPERIRSEQFLRAS